MAEGIFFDTIKINIADHGQIKNLAEAAQINFRYTDTAITIALDQTTDAEDLNAIIIAVFATAAGKPATQVISDHAWLKETFIPTVGKRGAAIIEARGVSSAASAANALIDHVKALSTVGSTVHSIAVESDGSYGFNAGVWAGVPVRTTALGTYEVVKGVQHDDFANAKIKLTNDELVGERETVKDMLTAK